MHIGIKGQAALDAAMQAMKERTPIDLFGNSFTVSEVNTYSNTYQNADVGVVRASVLLTNGTTHRELFCKAQGLPYLPAAPATPNVVDLDEQN